MPLAVLLATEASRSRGSSDIATTDIMPSEQRKTMVLLRLHRCPGLSAHLLFAYGTVQLVGKFQFSAVLREYFIFSTQQSLQTRGGLRKNFHACCGKFSSETQGWSRVMHKFAAFTWRSISSRKFCAWNYRCLCFAGKVAWITPESCMCPTWKIVFSAHLPASCMQRNIRAFPQAVLSRKF